MFGDRKRLLMGGGVVAVLVGAMWLLWPASPAPSASGPQPATRGAAAAARQAPAGPLAPVKMEALASERQEPGSATRNPFRYQPKAPPPPPPRPVVPPTPVNAEPSKPMPPPGPPPPPPIPLKFIGILERASGEKWAVLSDGKVTMHGKDGDIIDGRYRIVKIGAESIELTHVDGRGRQVVRLTGQ